MPAGRNNGNFKNFAFIIALKHVYNELITLDNSNFQNMLLAIRSPLSREMRKIQQIKYTRQSVLNTTYAVKQRKMTTPINFLIRVFL